MITVVSIDRNHARRSSQVGSKIPKAQLKSGSKVSATEYEENPYGNLFCTSQDCSAQLSFVKRHNRKCASKTIEVVPCFRLKRNEGHDINCKYNISGQLSIIARASKSEVFSAIEKSRYEFRLHILLKALWDLSKSDNESNDENLGVSGAKNKKYSNQGKLSNYLRTLKQILELRVLCEDNKDGLPLKH